MYSQPHDGMRMSVHQITPNSPHCFWGTYISRIQILLDFVTLNIDTHTVMPLVNVLVEISDTLNGAAHFHVYVGIKSLAQVGVVRDDPPIIHGILNGTILLFDRVDKPFTPPVNWVAVRILICLQLEVF